MISFIPMNQVVLTLVLVIGTGAALHADGAPNPVVDMVKKVMPDNKGGDKIEKAHELWAYGAGVVGFIIVFWLAWFLVRLLAFLVILGIFIGGIVVVCEAIHNQRIQTWQQLGGLVLVIGTIDGIAAVTANIYLIRGGMEGDKDPS